MHGSFFWYDLMTTDVSSAASFYGDVVGWSVRDSGVDGADYSVFAVGGQGVAGLMPLPADVKAQGVPPCWSGYIAVDDVDACAALVSRLGGAVHKPPCDVPGVIRFAVVADPQGARFVIGKGMTQNAPAPPPPGTPGTVGWHELYAGEWRSAFAFYATAFGWTKGRAIDMGAAGEYQLFQLDGRDIGGMMTKPPTLPMACWGFYFTVEKLDDAIARVTRGGGHIIHGPIEVPGGSWIVQCVDPQNAFFSLVSAVR